MESLLGMNYVKTQPIIRYILFQGIKNFLIILTK